MTSTQSAEPSIEIRNLSRWYGEVLGVNHVNVDILPGITGLVGPNGSGKSTLMNVMCGLLRPGKGSVRVFGQPAWNNPSMRRRLGYCSQIDSYYENFTGEQFLRSILALHGRSKAWTRQAAAEALGCVKMEKNARRKIRTYSKGMRQRIKIALALAHQPDILILDEPFNGLDPVGRREMMELLDGYASDGRTVVLSSHILHEIEQMTTRILMMSSGYVMAEGDVSQVRDLLRGHPFQVYVRCDQPRKLAALMLIEESVIRCEIEDERSVRISTLNPDEFYPRLTDAVLEHDIDIEVVTLADENVQSIYQYLSGREHH